ncbi:MAG TPA: sulfotransferase domain-containing protein, partial [Aliidongia sp.]|uniref:sulfotransferase domain-containing protein n=1 Tax=Aliidongia sp. TaxID=1914230 RepID=UPI002DDD5667
TAGAIYIIRDPRDVVISYSHHQGKPVDYIIDMMRDEAACVAGDDATVYEYLSSWSRHVQSWTHTPSSQLLVLRYEDMLDQPLKSFAAVPKFLGLDVPRPRLEKAMKLSSFKVLKAQEQRKGFIERPAQADAAFFREGKAGQWRKILTPAQVARIEADHGEQMRRFGYL